MLHDPAAVRAAFEEASNTFLTTLRAVDEAAWDRPGALGDWTVRELSAHALRAYVTVDGYLDAEPVVDRVLADAAEYYNTVLSDPDVHRGVLTRGRQAGRQLFDPVGESETTAAQVLARIASSADDEPVNTFVGQITLSEYLATRVVELGIHTLDLQRATGQHPELHPVTLNIILSVLVQLAPQTTLALALTGREPLPAGFNVLS